MIIANNNEPQNYKELADQTDNILIDYLIIGDEKKYAIERKEICDLIQSLNDGRLWEQLKTLNAYRDEGYRPLLVIEGKPWLLMKMKKLTLKKWYAILIAVSSFGVPYIALDDRSHFKLFIEMLNEKAGKKTEYVRPTIRKPSTRTIEEERIDVLTAIDGIGVKTAEKLLDEYKSIYAICNTELDKLKEVLNEKNAEHLYTVLH